ncbi:roadblock/LC7 domain-containing protein [Planctomycetota bacterium]
MDKILQNLNQAVGIIGSIILTKDGDYVIGDTGGNINQTVGSAFAADIVKTCRRNLENIGKADFSQFIIESTEGKIVLFDAGPAYLFVIADPQVLLNVTILDIQSAAMKIQKELS